MRPHRSDGLGVQRQLCPNSPLRIAPPCREVTLPGWRAGTGEYAFIRCAALTTVNLSQVTQIDESAFRGCTSLKTLTLDNVAAIGLDAFYGCTGLETLKIPKCTRFGNYIVTGCKSSHPDRSHRSRRFRSHK